MNVSSSKLDMPFVGIPSFCRFPVCTDIAQLDADIAVLGVPYDEGGSYRPGMRFAPRRIREMSMRYAPRGAAPSGFFDIQEQRTFLDYEVRHRRMWDCGDVDVIYSRPMDTFANVTEATRQILGRGAFPVVFGGDHSITFPVIRAYDVAPLDIVMIDAHLDFTDSAVGVTHAGMNPFRRAAELPNVRKIVQIGIRGIRNSRAVYQDALANGNVVITATQLRRDGVACLERALPLSNVYFSIDIDGLDPSIAPGCSGTDPGGVLYEEVKDVMAFVARSAPVVGFDITEVNPMLDVGDMTSGLAAMLTLELLGMLTDSPHWSRRRTAQSSAAALAS